MVHFSDEDRQEDNIDMDTETDWTESPAGLCGN